MDDATLSVTANSYARSKDVAVVVLKPLKGAVRDGDNIRAVVRHTGVNQGGSPRGPLPEAISRSQTEPSRY